MNKVAVMYSGGADSVALLEHVIEYHAPGDITVIYVDFDCAKTNPLREQNLQFVLDEVGKHELPLIIRTETPVGKKGPEGNARLVLTKVRESAEATFDMVYIGHNMDDHIETVMIQLFRGAGDGARGIPDYQHGKIFRPLLTRTRQEIRDDLDARGIPYFVDPSNSDLSLTRPFWRDKVIPLLKEHYGKGVYAKINKIASKFGSDYDK